MTFPPNPRAEKWLLSFVRDAIRVAFEGTLYNNGLNVITIDDVGGMDTEMIRIQVCVVIHGTQHALWMLLPPGITENVSKQLLESAVGQQILRPIAVIYAKTANSDAGPHP